MSYCRWSSEDFLCDLYVYESIYGGYVINIAGSRRVYHKSLPPSINHDEDAEGWLFRNQLVMDLPHDLVAIDLKYASDSFIFSTPEETIVFLEELKTLGYNFPGSVITDLSLGGEENEL